jgi:hypothetical protein
MDKSYAPRRGSNSEATEVFGDLIRQESYRITLKKEVMDLLIHHPGLPFIW